VEIMQRHIKLSNFPPEMLRDIVLVYHKSHMSDHYVKLFIVNLFKLINKALLISWISKYKHIYILELVDSLVLKL
jgi:hypothetical protein